MLENIKMIRSVLSKKSSKKAVIILSLAFLCFAAGLYYYVHQSETEDIYKISDPNVGIRAAAINDNLAALKYHHQKGGNINQMDGIAIRWAAWNGDAETTKYLLEQGADPEVLGNQPLRNAKAKGHENIAELIQAFHKDQEKAPLDWDEKVVKTEVNKGFACPNARLKDAYKGKGGFKYIVKGKNDWIFRSEADFQEHFDMTRETRKELGRFVSALKDQGISLVMVVQPTRGIVGRDYLIKDAYNPDVALKNYNRLIRDFNNMGIIAPNLMESGDMKEYFLKQDIHWTSTGADQSARMVANAMQPIMGDISRKKYITEVAGKEGFKGGLLEAYESVCDLKLEEDTSEFFKTTTNEGDLFGDAIPRVALVGTSNSAIARANFGGALAEHLSADVLNMAVSGGGVTTSILDYLSSDEFKKYPPKIIVWEFRANDKLTASFFSQLSAAVIPDCEKILENDVALDGLTDLGAFPPQKNGRGYLKVAIDGELPISMKFSSVYGIRKNDPVEMITTERMKRKNYYIGFDASSSDYPKSVILETPIGSQIKARVTFCGIPAKQKMAKISGTADSNEFAKIEASSGQERSN